MFLSTQEILHCQNCQKKYDEPKILPCGNTICNNCIKTFLTNKKEKKKTQSQKSNSHKILNGYEMLSNEFKCLMCEENHEFPPDNAFPTNQQILKLLTKDLKLFNFGESAAKLKNYVESINENKLELQELTIGGKNFIEDYCMKIRKDIDFSAEKEIECIYKRQEELCGETRVYEKQTIDAYERNKENVHEKLKLNDLFHQIKTFELNHSNLDVLEATSKAKSLIEKINHTKELLTKSIFNERIITFIQKESKSTKDNIGFFKYSK
jgi:hypothetical protein